MVGFVQSLNVSVAAAIMLWEITRQRGRKNTLNKSEKAQLLETLVKKAA